MRQHLGTEPGYAYIVTAEQVWLLTVIKLNRNQIRRAWKWNYNLRITVSSWLFEAFVYIGVSMDTSQEYTPEAEKSNFESRIYFSLVCAHCNVNTMNQYHKFYFQYTSTLSFAANTIVVGVLGRGVIALPPRYIISYLWNGMLQQTGNHIHNIWSSLNLHIFY